MAEPTASEGGYVIESSATKPHTGIRGTAISRSVNATRRAETGLRPKAASAVAAPGTAHRNASTPIAVVRAECMPDSTFPAAVESVSSDHALNEATSSSTAEIAQRAGPLNLRRLIGPVSISGAGAEGFLARYQASTSRRRWRKERRPRDARCDTRCKATHLRVTARISRV